MAMRMSSPRFLLRFLLIYLLDWVVIIGTIAFSGSMHWWATPNARPFSLSDRTLQFPYQTNSKVPTWLLVVLAGVLPAVCIFLLTLSLPATSWRRKIYSLNTAWLGLGLAIATGMLLTDGLKNIVGRPRPDVISRCDPHTEEAWIKNSTIGPGELVDWAICRNRYKVGGPGLDESDLRDGFRSFPSGHASMSFAGLTYFAMFLAEFVFSLPFPALQATPVTAPIIAEPDAPRRRKSRRRSSRPPRTKMQALEPLLPRFPIMLALLVCAVPVLLALYIASTRYSDFRHHPFDVIAGSLVGLFAGFTGWRWYGGWSCAGEGGRRGVEFGKLRGGDREMETGGEEEEESDEQVPKVRNSRREGMGERGGAGGRGSAGWRDGVPPEQNGWRDGAERVV